MRARNRSLCAVITAAVIAAGCLSASIALAKQAPRRVEAKPLAKDVRVVKADELSVTQIRVHPSGTVISFPVKPTKVILGNQKVFDVENVETDLAIAALTPNAAAHMFVYMFGRRFSFDLRMATSGGDKIVVVEDSANQAMPAVIE